MKKENSTNQLSPEALEEAFSLFNEASRQLVDSYQELEGKVASLSQELAVANGQLRVEFEAKSALSLRLSGLLAALPGGVVELDDHGVVTANNPAACSFLGADCVGEAWVKICEERLSATEIEHVWIRRGGVDSPRIQIVTSCPSGFPGAILLLQDVTQVWVLEQKLARNQRLIEMGQMSAGLAHQLRTPLAAALLYAANLARPAISDADRVKFADKMLARLRHLEGLIKNMLLFVKGSRAELTTVPVAQLVDEAMQTVQDLADKNQVVITSDSAVADVAVKVNRKEMTGALANLLENAIYASEPAGVVTIAAILDGVESVRIEVVDQGEGVEPSHIDRLFEPFFTTRKEGTGLGLAIVKNLVESYSGVIGFESKRGLGSKVSIWLPLCQ